MLEQSKTTGVYFQNKHKYARKKADLQLHHNQDPGYPVLTTCRQQQHPPLLHLQQLYVLVSAISKFSMSVNGQISSVNTKG